MHQAKSGSDARITERAQPPGGQEGRCLQMRAQNLDEQELGQLRRRETRARQLALPFVDELIEKPPKGHRLRRRGVNVNPGRQDIYPYQKSKTLSERAAWDFIAGEGRGLELSVVNPVAVFGPVLGPDFSHSIRLIQRLMDGIPGCPKVNSGFVDVRDVADLHLRAMTNPAAKGERFLAISGESMWMIEVAKVLKRRLGAAARRVPTRELPNWLIRLAALRDPAMKMVVPHLGVMMNATSEKARRLLGWTPRSNEESIVDTAESLMRLGILKDSPADPRTTPVRDT